MKIKFFDYCIIVFGDIEDISIDLEAISEGNIHYLDVEGLYMATFCSAMRVNELKEFFSSIGRNFILTLVDKHSFAAHMIDQESHSHLFAKRDYFKVDYADLKKQLEVIGKAIKEEDQDIQEELKPTLDELLDKITNKGITSLSKKEKKYLDEYSS
jgi:hypothetical protein